MTMTRATKTTAAILAVLIGSSLLTGCAAVREFLATAPVDLPQPSLPAQPEPWEKIYQGGKTPDNIGQEDWATTSKRRITAMGALHKVVVYGVNHESGSNALTVLIKGDPTDTALIENVETYVAPVALAWAPTVTIIVDSSLCGVVSELRDESPLCDALTGS
jgi:hypothetical protein